MKPGRARHRPPADARHQGHHLGRRASIRPRAMPTWPRPRSPSPRRRSRTPRRRSRSARPSSSRPRSISTARLIRSPIDGTVISRTIDVGQTVAASLQAPELFKIAQDLRRIRIEAQVNEADVGSVAEGNTVDVHGRRLSRAPVRGQGHAGAPRRHRAAERRHLHRHHRGGEPRPQAVPRHDRQRPDRERAKRDNALRIPTTRCASSRARRCRRAGRRRAAARSSCWRGVRTACWSRRKDEVQLIATRSAGGARRDASPSPSPTCAAFGARRRAAAPAVAVAAASRKRPRALAGAGRRARRQRSVQITRADGLPADADGSANSRCIAALEARPREHTRRRRLGARAASGMPESRNVRIGIADDQFAEVLGRPAQGRRQHRRARQAR